MQLHNFCNSEVPGYKFHSFRIPLSCDPFVTPLPFLFRFCDLYLSSGRSWHWLFHSLEVLSWQLWFQPFRPLTLYKRHQLHPGKLTFWTQKWRFGRWCSFSIWWFLGSMVIFRGVAFLGMEFQVAFRKGVFRCVWCKMMRIKMIILDIFG